MTEIATKSFDDFDLVDRVRWSHVILSHLRSLEGLYVQRALGPIAINAWESQLVFIERFASWRAVRGFWFGEAASWGWDEGFKAYVSRVMNEEEQRGIVGKAFGAP